MHVMMSASTEMAVALWRATPSRPRLVYIRPDTERGATFALGQFGRYERAGHDAAVAAMRDLSIQRPGEF